MKMTVFSFQRISKGLPLSSVPMN